ncbi:MAG: efflux RND transporter periplasmic adaptor subunit, partial [Myxococcota bacterium]
LRDTRLVAAYAGTVVARHAEPGQRVRPGEVVVSIEGGAPEIVVAIPESLSARLEVGAEHAVAISGIDEPLSGEIKRIGRAAPGSALFEVALGLPSNLGLRSGSTAEVRLRGGTRNATVSIPVPAFLAGDADDAGFVFVVDDDRVFRVPVRVGAIEGDRIVVSEGLDGDERVAVSGVSFLRDGQGIRLLGEGVSPFLE